MNIEYRSLSLAIRHSSFVILFCFTSAWGQSNTREPKIGYLYPRAVGSRAPSFKLLPAASTSAGQPKCTFPAKACMARSLNTSNLLETSKRSSVS